MPFRSLNCRGPCRPGGCRRPRGLAGRPPGPAGHVSATLDDALSILKLPEPLPAVWLSSPPKLAEAAAVPALTLSVYETSSSCSSPPAPVALAEQGLIGSPL